MLLCLLKDTVSHLKQAKVSSYLKSSDEKLDSIIGIVSKNVPNAILEPVSSSGIQASSWAEVVKETIEERHYDKEAGNTVVMNNISDSDDINATQSAACTFEKMGQGHFVTSHLGDNMASVTWATKVSTKWVDQIE